MGPYTKECDSDDPVAGAADAGSCSEEAKGKLTRAFALLRKEGFVARQRFSCCRGCAGCALATEQQEKQAAGEKLPKSYVYYTKQEGFISTYGGEHATKLYLSFGDFTSEGQGEPTDTSGYTIVKALKEAGLEFQWNGNPESCIVVDPCPGLWD